MFVNLNICDLIQIVNIAELRTCIALNKEFTISKLKDSWMETCYLFQNVSIKNIIRF